MWGFHELRVTLKGIYKLHTIRGYQKWVIDAKTIVPGSSDAAVEGRYYYRNTETWEPIKEMFCALVLYKIEELTIDMGIFISYFWT